MSVFRQPLIQCLLLGLIIYLLYLAADDGSRDDKSIVVTEDKLLTFMQYRARAFDEGRAMRAWKVMQPDDKQRLIADYLRDELLYREARSLGLSNEDFVIRQRLIQKAEYLMQGQLNAEPLIETAMQTYFEAHQARYFLPASVTFSHIFFKQDADLDGVEASLKDISEAQALTLGDRFPYHRNYSDSGIDEVAAHFGRSFADDLFDLATGVWQGPLKSAYGYHFVLVERIQPGRAPTLAEVHDQVVADATRQRDEIALAAAVEDLKKHYEISVELE